MNLAGDALGLVTGGPGKVASTAAKAGAKTALRIATKQGVKAMTKETLKEAAKQGGKAAVRAGRKQLTKKGMKKYAKKYVKKKTKKAIKTGLKEAAAKAYEDEEDEEDEFCILEELHRFSGHWNGFYKQWGSKHPTECMMVIDLDGNIAARGSDEVSDYSVSGKLEPDGTFEFCKQYNGPTQYHQVVYTGSVEWKDQPVLQGKWTIPSDGQIDDFVIVPDSIGLEASVISLCCYSAKEVLAMNRQQKRREIVDALCEIVLDMSRAELASLSDEELINVAEALTTDELYEE